MESGAHDEVLGSSLCDVLHFGLTSFRISTCEKTPSLPILAEILLFYTRFLV